MDSHDRQDGECQLPRLQDPDGQGCAGRGDRVSPSIRTTPSAIINGAKGLGEPATIPAGAAIANAFYHATGIRVTAAPITAAQVLTLLAERKARG